MKCLLIAINAKYIHSNLGVYSLKAYGEQEERGREGVPLEIEIAEYTINNQMERLLEDVYRRQPEVVGISCYIWNITYVWDLIHDLHKVLPETDIWLGGPEVSFDAPRLLEREKEVLGVMKGEGEETFAGLMACYRTLGCSARHVMNAMNAEAAASGGMGEQRRAAWEKYWEQMGMLAGVTFRGADGAVEDKEIRPVMDLNRIPFPYKDMGEFSHRIVYYESSRGCPFSCSYCLSSIDKTVRFRDLELVKRELDFFLERRVPQVKFVDRTFNCRKSHAMAIWRHILEYDNGVTNFHFEIAADLLDEEERELLGKMRPGLVQLEIGVQSANPDTIRQIHRKMDLDKVEQVVAQINARHNVHQHLDLIAGLPGEGYESFHHSFNRVYAMKPAQLQLGFLKVLKGSPMYQAAGEYKLSYGERPPYEVLSTAWLSYGEIIRLKAVEDMVEVYFNSGQFSFTLDLLGKEFADAFTLYERLAGYYEEKGLKGFNHSRMARYEILHQFIVENLPGERRHDRERLEDALTCDVYLREKSKSRPSFALDQKPYRDNIRKAVLKLEKEGRQFHVEMLRSGKMVWFDYEEKDPLTGNAVVRLVSTNVML